MSLDCDLEDMDVNQNPPTKIPFEWETIYMDEGSNTCRVKVIGGWMMLHIETSEITGYVQARQTMQFIPDPFHQWSVEE